MLIILCASLLILMLMIVFAFQQRRGIKVRKKCKEIKNVAFHTCK